MKKIAAILLIIIFTFNLIGYRGLFYFAQRASDNEMEAYLDHTSYNDQDLLEINAPINLPYYNNDPSFERVDGEININGTIYKYVKRRIYEGKVTVLCLPDYQKTNLESAKNEFSKNNLLQSQTSNSSKSTNTKLNLSKLLDAIYENNQFNNSYLNNQIGALKIFGTFTCKWPTLSLPTPEQPPEMV